MRLNPEELVVSSFDVGGQDELEAAGTHSPVCPTPQTACFVCPVETYTCA
jgi:hypothetical protein